MAKRGPSGPSGLSPEKKIGKNEGKDNDGDKEMATVSESPAAGAGGDTMTIMNTIQMQLAEVMKILRREQEER
eukprot:14435066-Heterocapsa_arctica.AAC.1